MGKAGKRVNPKVTCQTNRNFKKRYMWELLRQIDKLPPPWKANKVVRRFRKKKMIVILDATGFRVKTSSGWYDIRIKRMRRKQLALKVLAYNIKQIMSHIPNV